jgi:hypothetical protein
MESVLMGHPERDMPFCVRDIKIAIAPEHGGSGRTGQAATATLTHAATSVIAEITANHQTRRTIIFDSPVTTARLEIQILTPSIDVPAALFAVRCFS